MTSLIFSRLRNRKRAAFKASDAAEIKNKTKKKLRNKPRRHDGRVLLSVAHKQPRATGRLQNAVENNLTDWTERIPTFKRLRKPPTCDSWHKQIHTRVLKKEAHLLHFSRPRPCTLTFMASLKRRRHGPLQLPPEVDVVDGRMYVFVGSDRIRLNPAHLPLVQWRGLTVQSESRKVRLATITWRELKAERRPDAAELQRGEASWNRPQALHPASV